MHNPFLDDGDEFPDEFQCPIGLCIMHDPVVLSDGHTYERENLASWLEKNNTSPKTNEVLNNKVFFPNHNLLRLISKWREAHGPSSRPLNLMMDTRFEQ